MHCPPTITTKQKQSGRERDGERLLRAAQNAKFIELNLASLFCCSLRSLSLPFSLSLARRKARELFSLRRAHV